jgi:aldehyde dehydrogenase (NAD+)
MILKSPQGAPFTAQIIAEIIDAAGVPAGVFNLIHGDARGVGVPLCEHPGVDMISFTGSTSAGVEVAKNAAATVKRVHQELGGKSPLIVLDDEALALGVKGGVEGLMRNSGQTCNAPTRMLVPASRLDEAIAAAKEAAEGLMVGDPLSDVDLGPVASKAQYDKIRSFIAQGVKEGARLVAGGLDRPDGVSRGYFIKPTVFADVSPQMAIAREEIFGPVMSIMTYRDLDEAVELGNDTDYGLAAYVNGTDLESARDLASRLRAGQVIINGAFDIMAPFGGYKRSGNGREWGDLAFQEFLEVKAVLGFTPVAAA